MNKAFSKLLPILACPICHKNLKFINKCFVCIGNHKFLVKSYVPIFTKLNDYLEIESNAWEEEWKSKISKEALKAYEINMSVFKSLGYWEESGNASNLIPSKKDDTVLDLGCGNGVSTSKLKAKQAVGLDLSTKQLVKSKNKYSNCSFIVGDARKLPFRDSSFDMVVAINMLHHVKNPQVVLKECFRVLKSGGRLLTVDPNLYNPIGFIGRGIYKLLRLKKIFPTFPQFALGEDEYQFSKKNYYHLFTKSPFKNFTIRPHRLERIFFFASILIPSLIMFPFYKNIIYILSRIGENLVKISPLDNICYFWKCEAIR